MSSSTPSVGANIRYRKLQRDHDGWSAAQFEMPPTKVPYKAIAHATILFVIGTILLIFGCLTYTGVILVEDPDRWVPMIVLGSLMFIPGSYHVGLAYKAWMQTPGYSFDDIPSSFDE
eukprot:m.18460 g.18460  ORF g.18460 m.18460 type:complete len:117 (+) comp12035_c0_seq1:343-693(+)